MKSKILRYVAVTVAAVGLMSASTSSVYALAGIEVSAIDLGYLALNNGTMLPAGDLIQIGQFSVSDATLQGLAGGGGSTISPANYATLLSDFVPLAGGIASGTVGAGAAGYAGAFDITFTGNNAGFAGGPIYIMVFNAATSGAATQVGVIRGDSSWNYPASMATGSTAVDLDTAVAPLIGTLTTGRPYSDSLYNVQQNLATSGTIKTFNLATIPEPSTVALVGLGLVGMLGLIRRRRS